MMWYLFFIAVTFFCFPMYDALVLAIMFSLFINYRSFVIIFLAPFVEFVMRFFWTWLMYLRLYKYVCIFRIWLRLSIDS